MKIKELSNDGLVPMYRHLAQMVGITDPPTGELMEMTSKLLKGRFAHLETADINEAGELYASGQITGFEHFNKFNPAFIGRLMAAMQERLKSEGRLMTTFDQERQSQDCTMINTSGLPIEYEKDGRFNWGHYLNDLYKKIKNGTLQPITLFVPPNVYEWMVFKGHLEADGWHLYSEVAVSAIQKKRRPQTGLFANIGSSMVNAFNTESESKKLAVLDYLDKKIK